VVPRRTLGFSRFKVIRKPAQETTPGSFPYLPAVDVQLILSVRVILTAPFSPLEGVAA
jgi:hypothetical protein